MSKHRINTYEYINKNTFINKILNKLGFIGIFFIVFFLILILIFKNNLPVIIYNTFDQTEIYYVKNNDLYNREDTKIGTSIYDVSFAENEGLNLSLNTLDAISKLNFNPLYNKDKNISITVKNYDTKNKNANISINYLNNHDKNVVFNNVDINSVKVSSNFDKMLYIKTEDKKKNLYYYDFKNEKLVLNDITEYYANDDLNKMYFVANNEIYYANDIENKKLIATNSVLIKDENGIPFDKILSINDFNYIYYMKYNDDNKTIANLYKKYIDTEDILISEEIHNKPIYFYNEDFIYFNKTGKEEIKVSEFVIDDIADGSFYNTAPNINDYRSGFFGLFTDTFGYLSAKNEYDRVVNFINRNEETIKKYHDQIERGTFNNTYDKLYYYDGNNVNVLSENMIKTVVRANTYKPYIYFESYVYNDLSNVSKVKLSDIIKSNLTVNNYMKTVRNSSKTDKYIYHKDIGTKIENIQGTDISVYKIKNDFIIKSKDGFYNQVYRLKLDMNKVCVAELYANIITNEMKIYASPYIDDVIFSVTNGGNNAYLYKNQERIEDNCHKDYIYLSNDLHYVTYITNYDNVENIGLLKILENGKVKIVDENVLVSSIKTNASNGELNYITEFDKINLCGKFIKYDKYGRRKTISKEVMNIILPENFDIKLDLYTKKDILENITEDVLT